MGEEASSSTSSSTPTSSSHGNQRLKFLCSFGGRILPRPPDGNLKYVGGDTRLVVSPRPLSFTDLREKIAAVCDADVIIKYQLFPEDLDALVTVRSDEDVRHMIDEYDRLELMRSSSSPTAPGGAHFRIYLFPSKHNGNQSHHPHASVVRHGSSIGGGHLYRLNTSLEQRYIDAVNGVSPPRRRRECLGGGGGGGGGVALTVTSPVSSPGSRSGDYVPMVDGASSERFRPMHKAHSSPNLQLLSEGGSSLHHYHLRRHHRRQLGSPQWASHAGAPTGRMGGGCSHWAAGSRPVSNRRPGIQMNTGCHLDDPRWSGEGCRGLRWS